MKWLFYITYWSYGFWMKFISLIGIGVSITDKGSLAFSFSIYKAHMVLTLRYGYF